MNLLEQIDDASAKALEHWGMTKQINKSIEEAAELIVSLSKYLNGGGTLTQVVDEIADVQIMLRQLRHLFGASLVDDRIVFKTERLKKILEQEMVEAVNDSKY